MTTTVIIGYGNTLRADDALGPTVVQTLEAERFPANFDVRTICLPQLDVSLVTTLEDADLAIFIDARHDEDETPICVDRIAPAQPASIVTHSTHAIDISALLGIVQQWYGRHPDCFLIKPKGYDFSISDALSRQGEAAAAAAKEAVYQILEQQ